MEITLSRVSSDERGSIGALALPATYCWTLEDPHRDVKVARETRIPAGRYELKLRAEGEVHKHYLARFGAAFHHGMLWLQRVPGFQWIYLHCGNTPEDTDGCVLVGAQALRILGAPHLTGSETAYRAIYPLIAAALLRGERVFIKILDVA